MLSFLEKTIMVTGHYGSGKTNLSVNLALDLRKQGREVALIDLDIVNPYFRTADFKGLAEEWGIALYASPYANSNAELPTAAARLGGTLGGKATVIVDVGGDDSGATALGGYARRIRAAPYTMLYVVNCYRYMTRSPEEASGLMREIQRSSRLQVTHLVNNSHMSHLTTELEVEESLAYAGEVSRQTGKPLAFSAVSRELTEQMRLGQGPLYPVDIYVNPPWHSHFQP